MIAFSVNSLGVEAQQIGKDAYLSICQTTANYHIEKLESQMKKWRQRNVVSESGVYNPVAQDVYLAALCANLYEVNDEKDLLESIKTLLYRYGEYYDPELFAKDLRAEYVNGVPPIPNFFVFPQYARAYDVLRQNTRLSEKEKRIIERHLAKSADYHLLTQEWGPMNRSMLRAYGLLYTAKLLPHHPNQPRWKRYGEVLLNDNLGNWSIEDASMYGMIWLHALISYQEFVADTDQKMVTPMMQYYLLYYKNLLSPQGVIPDFGDAWWNAWWHLTLPVFEYGAKTLNDPELRWSAHYALYSKTHDKPNISMALKLSEALLWGNMELKGKKPLGQSTEVLDDQIGKKMVFRSGWDAESAYLLYNYKDQGDGGWLFKENMKQTLCVPHEKAHHGHEDEQSIAFFSHNGSVLLHDAGYRTHVPSDDVGSYRADYFHNRVIWRSGIPKEGTPFIDMIQDSGTYQPVETQKIDFLKSEFMDFGRTRLIDEDDGVVHDRAVNYIKALGAYVVFDFVKATKDAPKLITPLWHTQNILDSGKNWYLTRYDSIEKWQNPSETNLFICYPANYRLLTRVSSIERHRQKEFVIGQYNVGQFRKGDIQVFTTVLWPITHEKPDDLQKAITFTSTDNGVMVRINHQNKVYATGHKVNLQADNSRTWPKPSYTWESSKVDFGLLTTDGHAVFTIESENELYYFSAGTTRVIWEGATLFSQPAVTNDYRMDGGPATAAPWKVRVAQGTVKR